MLDLVLRGAQVFDGRGGEPFRADVGVRDGRIALVGRWDGEPAARQVDCDGLALAPGFIDMLGQSEYTVLVDPQVLSKTTQ